MIRVQTASGPIIVGGALRDKTIELSATAPASPAINDVWYDFTSDELKRWNGSAWITSLAGSALENSDIGSLVQAYSTILQNTTASFTTALNTKLNGIETGATADQTAAEILAALLTVDGAGSGLDADLLDGLNSSSFMPSATTTATVDWNNYIDTGFYMGSSLANQTPYKVHNWQYTMIIRHNTSYSTQLAFDFDGSGFGLSTRTLANGIWSSWRPLGFGDRLLGRTDAAAAYTLVATDAGKVVRGTSASAQTITVPANATVPFALDTIIQIYSAGAGLVTIAGASGVTIRNNTNALKQYQEVSLRKDATDEWVRVG